MSKPSTGFTLIELLVVIAIIGLLSSVVMSALSNARGKGRDTAKVRSLQEVRTALQVYHIDNGGYPGGTDLSVLVPIYISSVDANLIYSGTSADDSSVCLTSPCPSYHLGVALESKDNKALSTDKDISTGFPVSPSGCGVTASSNDYCYDITP